MKIWSFTIIDWDLLHTDPDSVDTAFPLLAWRTRGEAEDAVATELLDAQEYLALADEELFAVDKANFDWLEDSSTGRKRWIMVVEELNSHVYLYEMDLVGLVDPTLEGHAP